MSAMTGIGDSATIVLSASTSLSRGTAQRIRSPPASATARIWRSVAWTSAVSVFVIDWTTTGAPPPIGTPPTFIWRAEAMAGTKGTHPDCRFGSREPRGRPRSGPGDPDRLHARPTPADACPGAGQHLVRRAAPAGDGA